jgi:NTE family protein
MLRDLPRPVGLVLAGGGVYGAAHVGAGHALEQRGFVPQIVVGTSVGALNGAMAAAHPGAAAESLDQLWTSVRRGQVFPFAGARSAGGICTDRGLRRIIAKAGLPPRIEQLAVPFTAVAVYLYTGAPALLDRGDLESALLASAAIPGIFPPVSREGRLLIDGGPLAYVPVRAAQQAGAASLVVVTAGPESWPLKPTVPPRRPGAIAARAGLLALHHQIEHDLQEVAEDIPTVVLPTGIDVWPAPWNLRHSRRLICTAAATSAQFLDSVTVRGPGLYRVAALEPVETAGRMTSSIARSR